MSFENSEVSVNYFRTGLLFCPELVVDFRTKFDERLTSGMWCVCMVGAYKSFQGNHSGTYYFPVNSTMQRQSAAFFFFGPTPQSAAFIEMIL